MVDRLVTSPPPLPSAMPVPLQYTQTLTKFLQNEGLITAHVSSGYKSELVEPDQLENTNVNLNQLIEAALDIG